MVDQTGSTASRRAQTNEPVKRSGSVTSGRSSKRSKRNARRRRAKQWTCVVESFKHSTDLLYDFCQKEHSIEGCKEAILLLQNSVHDFTALINSIQVEEKWDSQNKPQAVAWEIRKTMSSPSRAIKEKLSETNAGQSILQRLPLSSIVLPSSCVNLERNIDGANDDGWQLVRRRRRSVSSVTSQSIDGGETPLEDDTDNVTPPKQTVYDRLYSSAVNRDRSQTHCHFTASISSGNLHKGGIINGRLMSPRCAMDLPQTKASMAKIAYSRQKLWQRNQSSLAEKLKARQKQQRMQEAERRSSSRCGINFADPVAVRKSAEEYNAKQRQKRQLTPGCEVRSLGSIRETAEDSDAIPSDPKPSGDHVPEKDSINVTSPVPPPPASWHGIELSLMATDDKWKAMTEEEESLAQEERSLTREMENEELMSIDDELERQVAAEAEQLELLDREKERHTKEEPSSHPPMSWQSIVNKWEKEMKVLASVSWSEIMEKEMMGHYREPGDGAAKHEKLSSPGRQKRNDNVDLQKKHELKQKRADVLRQKLLDEKAARLRELGNKIAEVRARQVEIRDKKMEHYFNKLKKADDNRSRNLAEIVKRAKEDDQKVQEVNFINSLEADLFAMDKMDKEIAREKEMERRREQMADERARRQEEKAAKEQKAEERRKHAEQERVARIQERVEHKAVRGAQLGALREEQERERREKRRLREERHEVNKAAVVEKRETLWKQKQIKLDSCSRRHLHTLGAVRAKAHQLASPKANTRWTILSESSAWPAQTIERQWLCVRCHVKLSSELDSMAHVISSAHLDTWKVRACDVTHYKLEMELCESMIECDSSCNSLATSVAEESDIVNTDKKKIQKQKLKIVNRLKKCTENIVSSIRFKESKSCTGIDRQIRDLMNSLSNMDEKTFEVGSSEILRRLKTTPALESQLITSNLVDLLIEKLMKSDQHSERFSLKLLSLVNDLCHQSSLISAYYVISTQFCIWISENICHSLKNNVSDRLSALSSLFSCALSQRDNETILQEWGMNEKELFIRTDMLAGYMSAMDISSHLYSFVTSRMDTDVISSDILTLIQNICDWMKTMAHRADTEAVRCLIDVFSDSLLFGMLELLRAKSNNGQPSAASNQTIPDLQLVDKLCSCSLDFFSSLSDSQFKAIFSNSDSRSFRFCLILSDAIRSIDSSVDRKSIDFRSVVLAGKLASIGSTQQLLCVLGCSGSVIFALSQFPVTLFVSERLSPLLFSSLITISYNFPQATEQIKQNMNTLFLTRFLKVCIGSPSSPITHSMKRLLKENDLEAVVDYYDKTATDL